MRLSRRGFLGVLGGVVFSVSSAVYAPGLPSAQDPFDDGLGNGGDSALMDEYMVVEKGDGSGFEVVWWKSAAE